MEQEPDFDRGRAQVVDELRSVIGQLDSNGATSAVPGTAKTTTLETPKTRASWKRQERELPGNGFDESCRRRQRQGLPGNGKDNSSGNGNDKSLLERVALSEKACTSPAWCETTNTLACAIHPAAFGSTSINRNPRPPSPSLDRALHQLFAPAAKKQRQPSTPHPARTLKFSVAFRGLPWLIRRCPTPHLRLSDRGLAPHPGPPTARPRPDPWQRHDAERPPAEGQGVVLDRSASSVVTRNERRRR